MMDILQRIKEYKIKEVAERKDRYPLDSLKDRKYYDKPIISLAEYVRRTDRTGVIAEFKKKSPSEGFINRDADVQNITAGYIQAGASALSVLTDENFFGGSDEDLDLARQVNSSPILRKDFTVDAYQIHEARSIGADAILLIAEILTGDEIRKFADTAHELGMEVLMEIHSKAELEKYAEGIELIGVNNRNLKDFSVDIRHSMDLFPDLPKEAVKISESGIRSADEMVMLSKAGFDGFLIGTQFMKTSDPVKACTRMLDDFLKKREK